MIFELHHLPVASLSPKELWHFKIERLLMRLKECSILILLLTHSASALIGLQSELFSNVTCKALVLLRQTNYRQAKKAKGIDHANFVTYRTFADI